MPLEKIAGITEVDPDAEVPVVNKELCIGCGICAAGCPAEALVMSRRSVLLPSPPKDKKEQLLALQFHLKTPSPGHFFADPSASLSPQTVFCKIFSVPFTKKT